MNNLLSKPVYNYLNLYVGDLDLYLGVLSKGKVCDVLEL